MRASPDRDDQSDKLREIRSCSPAFRSTLHSLADLPPVERTGRNGRDLRGQRAAEGALLLRAPCAARVPGDAAITVAEDSGLVIDALDGEPGVRSARFLGDETTYPERFAEIYRRLAAAARRAPRRAVHLRARRRSATRIPCSRPPASSRARSRPQPRGDRRLRLRPDLPLSRRTAHARRGQRRGEAARRASRPRVPGAGGVA